MTEFQTKYENSFQKLLSLGLDFVLSLSILMEHLQKRNMFLAEENLHRMVVDYIY